MSLINDSELTGHYSQLIEDYNRSAIWNKTALGKIRETIDVRYLLHVKLLDPATTLPKTGRLFKVEDSLTKQVL